MRISLQATPKFKFGRAHMIGDTASIVNGNNPVPAPGDSGAAGDAVSTHRRHLALELLATRERFMQHFRPVLTKHDVTEQQWRVIRALAANGEMEPGEITRRCVILKPSLTGILSRMEELGWIKRQSHAGDLRRSVVRLTTVGNALHRKISREVEAAHAALVDALGADELDALHAALDRFNVAMDRMNE
jgi:homoprotocatechuate degradation regulator HpaR